jgi:hypothetical protein
MEAGRGEIIRHPEIFFRKTLILFPKSDIANLPKHRKL